MRPIRSRGLGRPPSSGKVIPAHDCDKTMEGKHQACGEAFPFMGPLFERSRAAKGPSHCYAARFLAAPPSSPSFPPVLFRFLIFPFDPLPRRHLPCRPSCRACSTPPRALPTSTAMSRVCLGTRLVTTLIADTWIWATVRSHSMSDTHFVAMTTARFLLPRCGGLRREEQSHRELPSFSIK